jgi:hypothetical protein
MITIPLRTRRIGPGGSDDTIVGDEDHVNDGDNRGTSLQSFCS